MIKKLKFKFIFLSMISLLVLLFFLISTMNMLNYSSISNDADNIISVLSENSGRVPEHKAPKEKKSDKPRMSPETPYESRYFTVEMDKSGNVLKTNTSRIKSVDSQKASEYSKKILNSAKDKGYLDVYRYYKTENESVYKITFLDCRKQLDAFYSFLFSSIIMSLIGYAIVFIIIFFYAGKILNPIAESYEKQKRFVTDASHEIKTPLTIINANTDIIEAERGKSESIDEIRLQTKRLTELTNELVFLSKMEEQTTSEFLEIPISEVVKETTESFNALAHRSNICLNTNIEPMLTIKGNIKEIEQLTGILLENAVKYSESDSDINIGLVKRTKYVEMSISNVSKNQVQKENLKRLFDRFYRCDTSRNTETGGYGIGLSIAKAIVQKHSGKIYAEIKEKNIFKITVLLPA